MRRKKTYSRMYANRTAAARFISMEERLACEIHVVLEYPRTVALKHAYGLKVKPISLPALASRFFKQPHLEAYLEYLQDEKERMTRAGLKYW